MASPILHHYSMLNSKILCLIQTLFIIILFFGVKSIASSRQTILYNTRIICITYNNITNYFIMTNPFKLETDNKKFFFNVVNNASLEVIP